MSSNTTVWAVVTSEDGRLDALFLTEEGASIRANRLNRSETDLPHPNNWYAREEELFTTADQIEERELQQKRQRPH